MKRTLLLFALFFSTVAFGQKTGAHAYSIDLNRVENDRVKVTVDAGQMHFDSDLKEVAFHFPATIPGTYATLDYGRFINDFRAFNAAGEALKVKQKGNTFTIFGSPDRLEYWVDDTFDARIRKNKVFEPAGTNNQEGRNFLLNAAGYFGFFDGAEALPITLEVRKSPQLYGISALNSYSYGNTQNFNARDYHHFLDSPIMFSKPDTTTFRLANAEVTIAVFSESGRELSEDIYNEVYTSMKAIENFLGGSFPVDKYAFLFYIKDYSEFQGLVEGEDFRIGTIIRALRELSGQGFGALEHGNSSVYFLPDFGNDMVLDDMADVCIHEFFHILTPLNLHSEEIGQFNYIDPQMSMHLWLYEGITEYFAGISQVKGGVITPDEYIRSVLKEKITTGEKFPNEKMSFTEMSANVLENPWKKQYQQVYQRGALMGALLDLRIMELTNGEKTLLDVVRTLSERYGKNESFKDEDFIAEFVAEVHPDLQDFFDRYVTGREDLPVSEYLAKAGIAYERTYTGPLAKDPIADFDNKRARFKSDGMYTITKVSEDDVVGFVEGDKVVAYNHLLLGEFGVPAEGTVVELTVERAGKKMILPYTVVHKTGAKSHLIHFMKDLTPEQDALQKLWLHGHR